MKQFITTWAIIALGAPAFLGAIWLVHWGVENYPWVVVPSLYLGLTGLIAYVVSTGEETHNHWAD